MLGEALTLAAVGAVYPIAFAAIVALLGGPDPMRRAVAFLAGGLLVSWLGYVVVVVAVASLGLTRHHHLAISVGVRIALGVALLALAARTLVRGRRRSPAEVERDAARAGRDTGSVRRAFIAGVIVYLPGIFLVSSAVATAEAGAGAVVTAVMSVVCVVLLLLVVEIPIVAFALWGDRVRGPLQQVTALARRHSAQVVITLEVAAGVYLVLTGLSRL